MINHAHTGVRMAIDPGKYGKFIMKYIDGKRTFADIFALVKAEDKFRKSPPGDDELFADFKCLYDFFNAIDRLLLETMIPGTAGSRPQGIAPAAEPEA